MVKGDNNSTSLNTYDVIRFIKMILTVFVYKTYKWYLKWLSMPSIEEHVDQYK